MPISPTSTPTRPTLQPTINPTVKPTAQTTNPDGNPCKSIEDNGEHGLTIDGKSIDDITMQMPVASKISISGLRANFTNHNSTLQNIKQITKNS